MRILMVTGAYHPEVSGGGLQCRTLVKALQARVNFTILTTTTDPRAPKRETVDGVPVHRILVDLGSPAGRLKASMCVLATLPRLLLRTDIVHLHGFTKKMLPLVPLAKTWRIPVIAKMTSVGNDDPLSLRARMGEIAFRIFSTADRFISISPAMTERYLQSSLSPERLVFLPNGVDTDKFRPVTRSERQILKAQLGLESDAAVVTFVGFWSREKAPDVLFEAWLQTTREVHTRTSLVFVGAIRDHVEVNPAFVADLQARIARSGARVHFIEYTTRVDQVLAASDVFVLPSTREGMPNALLEAMATGLPCISTHLPGVTDWVLGESGSGLTFPGGDVHALAAALAAVLADANERERMGAVARATAVARFSIRAVAAQYESLYQTLSRIRAA